VTQEFFKSKRPWSRYKDSILRFYLDPYIPKVASLKKPILIVDCFAGCGTFGDGEPGSPLIISPLVKKWREKGVDVRAEFIEADADNFQSLERTLQPYAEFVTARLGSFEAHLPSLAERAKEHTVFLYVDPYTVKGLVFEQMKAVYDQIRRVSASVEVLLNFNVVTFMRWALAAVKRQVEFGREEEAEVDYLADDPTERIEMMTLDSIAGGSDWRVIAQDTTVTFQQKIKLFTEQYLKRLVKSFTYTAAYEVKEKYEHRVPKYVLVYGTRNPHGVELMNDGMCDARLEFLGNQFKKNWLFDLTPDEEIADTQRLKTDLLEYLARKRVARKELRLQAVLNHFCQFKATHINAAIGEMLKSGRLFSSTGKSRINDSVLLSATPFTPVALKAKVPSRRNGR
jgi:three-Cys-motif partner protein